MYVCYVCMYIELHELWCAGADLHCAAVRLAALLLLLLLLLLASPPPRVLLCRNAAGWASTAGPPTGRWQPASAAASSRRSRCRSHWVGQREGHCLPSRKSCVCCSRCLHRWRCMLLGMLPLCLLLLLLPLLRRARLQISCRRQRQRRHGQGRARRAALAAATAAQPRLQAAHQRHFA